MYASIMPAHAKVEFIKEIIEYAENEHAALDLITAFLDEEMSKEEIEDLIF